MTKGKGFGMTLRALAAGALLAVAGASHAGIIFADNFDGENGGNGVLNYNGFSNWLVTNGTVDLIGNGFFDFQPGNGLYVDMDGSTGDAGQLLSTAPITLGPGDYTLSFDLAGNHRNGAPEEVTVQVNMGSLFSEVFSLGRDDPFTTFTRSVSVASATSVSLSFEGAGGDNIGMLLDDISIASEVPAPGTLVLLGAGLLGLGALGRRRG